ncbi:class I SAM-dependent methyltransferase [Sphingomonas sp. Root241]|uniref:class I SAM-dependent methyltransferase n=1 Tax=Sphingomonas sp. Root241 TaxID=1736501 RepID=UPI0006FA3398|nr:class I SAM-dependent methyltransferase [Sphingomonas sp. Root241]KRC81710.1 hypothetical protein ASE13_04865 [Sphingomonas sp. Root241]
MYSETRNKLGFIEATPRPSAEDLRTFYEQKYYQQQLGQYSHSYSDDEIRFFDADGILAETTLRLLGKKATSLLDVGCGEGFFANYFSRMGWDIKCCDFSDDGLNRFHPELLKHFIKGDAYDVIRSLQNDAQFDLINFSNVLEHVLDPAEAVDGLYQLCGSDTVIRCVVPNDYSDFQAALLANQMTRNTWFAPPEHLSYFNTENIDRIFEDRGLRILSKQVTFPIELFLANPHANYVTDPSKGKQAHQARVFCVNHLVEKNPEAYVRYCEHAATLGFGRDIVVYAAKI